MTEMQVINLMWNIVLIIIIIMVLAGFIVGILIPFGQLVKCWIEDLIVLIKHEKQRKDAIARYKSDKPIFKDDLPEDKR